MNGAQLHLLLNHIPLFLPLFGGSALGLGLILKSSDVKKFGLCLLFASALAAIPAYLTGVPAERVVKNYPGILRAAIEAHQAAALISLILIETLGGLSLFFLVLLKFASRRGFIIHRAVWAFFLILATLSIAFTARTAHLGGMIRHEEIQTYKD